MVFAMGGGAAVAGPVDPDDRDEQNEIDRTQDVLSMFTPEQRDRIEIVAPLSDKILELAGSTDDWHPGQERAVDGYLLTVLGDRTLDIFWKGELPPEVRDVIAQHPSVKVVVHDVPYDEDEYLSAQKLVVDRLIADPPAGARYDAVLHAENRASLNFVLVGTMSDSDLADIEERIASWISIPFTVEIVEEPTTVALLGRQDDQSPWRGGAQIQIIDNGGWCTTGFPVTMNSTGNKYVTTARHCITTSTGTYIGSSGDVEDAAGDDLGIWKNSSAWNRAAYDVTLIKPDSGTIGASVYNGGINSTTTVSLSGAKSSPDPGGFVWGSGANSGANTLEVVSKNTGYTVSGTAITGGHVLAKRTSSTDTAGAQGDSGGSVMRVVSGKNYGVGSLSAIPAAYLVTCPTLAHNDGSAKCASRVYYTSLTGVLSSFDAEVGN